jgi:benzoyl-CoA reductase/2-hydroxyglutaryl-CoA dehydratase subunit BcrC/BadD/HgdB
MKRIIYTCPYVPAEWIASHGFQPSRLVPGGAGSAGSTTRIEGVCPYVRAFINEVIKEKNAHGVVVTTVCDQMRRASDILMRQCSLPLFLMNVPKTWQSTASEKLYLDELKRLGRFLVLLSGHSPTNDELTKVMLEYDSARKHRRKGGAEYLAPRLGPRLAGTLTWGSLPTDVIPLAIIGGPLLKEDFRIFDIIESSGGRVVLDATETGERGMCSSFDRRSIRDNPLMALAEAYFCGIKDVSRRPNDELYRWFNQQLKERDVRGIIFRRFLWCDLWHAELKRLKDCVNVPVLDIDISGDDEDFQHREVNRIRAFLETLQ